MARICNERRSSDRRVLRDPLKEIVMKTFVAVAESVSDKAAKSVRKK